LLAYVGTKKAVKSDSEFGDRPSPHFHAAQYKNKVVIVLFGSPNKILVKKPKFLY
jgi:hypothetical protein